MPKKSSVHPVFHVSESLERKSIFSRGNTGRSSQVHPQKDSEEQESPGRKRESSLPISHKNSKASVCNSPQKSTGKRRLSIKTEWGKSGSHLKKKKSLGPENFEKPFSAQSIKSQWSLHSDEASFKLGSQRSRDEEVEQSKHFLNGSSVKKRVQVFSFDVEGEDTRRCKRAIETQKSDFHSYQNQNSNWSIQTIKDNLQSAPASVRRRKSQGQKQLKTPVKVQANCFFGLQEGMKKTLDGEEIDIIKTQTDKGHQELKESEEDKTEIKKNEFAEKPMKSLNHSKYLRSGTEKRNIYARSRSRYNKYGFVILPSDRFRKYWTAWIFLYHFLISLTFQIRLIFYTCTVSPYRIAFLGDESENVYFHFIEVLIDICFIVDVGLTFITAYYDLDDNLITKKKEIAINYLSGWFLFDLISSFPFSLILSEGTSGKYYTLVKLSRFPKLARLARLFKLARMMKVIRNQRKYSKLISFSARIQPAVSRLTISIILTFIIMHIVSCLWGMAGEYNESDPDNWILRLEYIDDSPIQIYVASFYWTIQTTFSVGYGDLPAVTLCEKYFSSSGF